MHKAIEVLMCSIILLSSYSCSEMSDTNFVQLINDIFEEDSDHEADTDARHKYNFIFPGTKWCGAGNIADSYDDLGTAKEPDMCCRDHDYCPEEIPSRTKKYKYNLTNTSYHTRLSCGCDETFRKCLHRANSRISKEIGDIYFNRLGTKCFRKDYVVTGCEVYAGWSNRKCLVPIYDMDSPEVYQWFDVNNF